MAAHKRAPWEALLMSFHTLPRPRPRPMDFRLKENIIDDRNNHEGLHTKHGIGLHQGTKINT